MIKYIGSKRRLVPVLGELAGVLDARRVLDLFTGTTRVAQELKRRGMHVTAVDSARYADVFARCYVEIDADGVDAQELADALRDLADRSGVDGYVTETFCVQSRFFQPFNGRRIDAIRDAIEADYSASPLYPVLLTSLIEAADRVDSTTGVQMAYVKQWAARSFRPLELRAPELLAGAGTAVFGDACELAGQLGPFDFAYLDPPYNQHRYFTNYHIWETLVAWDAPVFYGVACKRVDARDPDTHSPFNERARMADALAGVIRDVDAEVIAVSYNDESWVTIDQLEAMIGARGGSVCRLAFDSRRYVGAQIGIHNPQGKKVGKVSRLRNVEYVVVGGDAARVARVADICREGRSMEIAGNVALVTGGASGLGEATARRLHARGAGIVLADLSEERGTEIAKELGSNALFVRCDITSEDDVAAAVAAGAELGRLSMSVHCAGGGIAGRTVGRDGTPHALDAFRRTVELNLVGTFNVLRLAAAQMSANEPDAGNERGVCVQTASIAGYEGQIGQIAYGSAKAGVIGMTIIAARDLAAVGVRVCTIAPGTIGTPPMMMAPESMREGLAATVPFPKRLGEPDEYAKLAQQIIENGYLNGEVIRLDGAVRFQPK